MTLRRRTLLSVGLGCACATAAAAQTAGRGASFGVLGGATFSSISGPEAEAANLKTRTSFAFGGFVRIGISRNIAIEPQLLYIRKGAKASDANVTLAARLGYLEVPVLVTVRFPAASRGGASPFFQAGPAVAFKLDCKVVVTNNTTTILQKCEDLEPDPILLKSTDLGLLFGAGVDVGRAKVLARYELGLSKIDDSGGGSDARNRSIVVLVGWTFRSP